MRQASLGFEGSAGHRASTPAPTVGKAGGLRLYQSECVSAVIDQWRRGVQSTAFVLPTGTGKTRTAAGIAQDVIAEPDTRGLWLAGRDFLVKEAARRLIDVVGPSVSIEMNVRTMGATRMVVGSVATMRGKRLTTLDPGYFTHIFYDECHHATAAGSRAIFEHFAAAKRVGFTATLVRHDKVGAWNAWESIAFERTTDWAWTEGYLLKPVPIARFIDSVNLSKIHNVAGDLNLGELEEEIAKAAAPIAHLAREEAEGRSTIVYTPGVASAHAVAATLNDWKPGSARAVDADTPEFERVEVLAAFDRGDLQFIVNCGIYLEGLDVPRCACIVIARPTKSQSLYIQMAGRGGRPEGWIGQLETRAERLAAIAASGKPNFKLVDITGHAGRHDLCSAATLAGKQADDVAAALKEVLEANEGIDLESAAKEANRVVLARAAAIAARARSAEVQARRATFDVLGKIGVPAQGDAPMNVALPPDKEDLEWLEKNHINDRGLTKPDVQRLRDTAGNWRRSGYATFGQRKFLTKLGAPVEYTTSYAAASKFIAAFKQRWVDSKYRWRANQAQIEWAFGKKEQAA